MKKTASLNYSTGKKWRLTGEDFYGIPRYQRLLHQF